MDVFYLARHWESHSPRLSLEPRYISLSLCNHQIVLTLHPYWEKPECTLQNHNIIRDYHGLRLRQHITKYPPKVPQNRSVIAQRSSLASSFISHLCISAQANRYASATVSKEKSLPYIRVFCYRLVFIAFFVSLVYGKHVVCIFVRFDSGFVSGFVVSVTVVVACFFLSCSYITCTRLAGLCFDRKVKIIFRALPHQRSSRHWNRRQQTNLQSLKPLMTIHTSTSTIQGSNSNKPSRNNEQPLPKEAHRLPRQNGRHSPQTQNINLRTGRSNPTHEPRKQDSQRRDSISHFWSRVLQEQVSWDEGSDQNLEGGERSLQRGAC